MKFNAESDKAQAQLQVLVDKFEHIAAAVTRAGERLQAFEADARELAENAERLDMLAYNTGKIEALREVNQVFSAGVATVSGYGEKVTECTNALIDFGGNAAKVLTEFQQGNLTMEQASAKLDRYSAAAAKNEKAVNSFASAVKRGFDELAGAASLDDALSAWGAFEENVDQARQQITAAAEAIQQKKEALGELKEELDSTSESYAEQAQHLAKQEVALNKQAAELQKLRAELDKLSASARDAFSSKNMGENLSGSMSQLTSLSSKLEVTLAHTTQALSKLEVAETSCAAAAQKEAEQEQAAAYAMRLSAMSKTKLADETRKLIAARKQAAAVGDVAAYQKLTAQLGQCRTAMRALLQQQQMTKIAMLQQAQSAAMMGNQMESVVSGIANFGKAAKDGSVNVTELASSVMSLSMAIKAGMGPIGWVMMAVQLLQIGWNAYARDAKASEERTLKLAEAHEKLRSKLQEVSRAEAQRRADALKDRWKEEDAALEYEQQMAEAYDRAEERLAREGIEREAAAARQKIELERGALEAKRKLGEVSDEEYSRQVLELARKEREVETKKQKDLRKLEVEEAKKRSVETVAALERARGRMEEAKNEMGKGFQFVGDAKVEDLMRQIEKVQGEQEELGAKKQNIQDVAEANHSMWDDVKKWGGRIVQNSSVLAMALGDNIPLVKEKNKIVEEEKKVEQKVADTSKKIAAKKNDINALYAQLAEHMGVSVAEAEKFAGRYAANKGLKESTEAALRKAEVEEEDAYNAERSAEESERNWEEQAKSQEATTRSLEEVRAAAEAESQKRQDGWLDMQSRTIAEQQKYVDSMLEATKEGSREWKQWARQSKALTNKKISEDLAELEDTYKITGNYAAQDAKTMSAIHAEDLKNLQLRRAEYERLKNTPDIDAATLKAINQKIKDTNAQTHRVQKSMKQAALEAQKSIGALQPLGQKAKVPNLQGPLRRAEKSFTELAKKAERQASNGDLKGLENSKKSMQRLALGMERMTGFTGKAAKLYEQVTEDLKKVQQGETKGLTAKQQTENNIRKKLGAEDRYRTKGAQAAEQSAKAAEAEAKAHEINAKNASQSVQANQPVNKAAQLSTDVNSLRAQVQQMETAQQTLNSNMGGLGGAVGKLAAAAENTAALAGKMATAAAAALGRLEKKISALEKQIDRINRKI